MPKIQINDISMYYEIQGQGEPIVFIPGFGCDHTVWSLAVDILKMHYKIILLDNRGSGQTDVPAGPYSIDQMASDVVALCSKLGIVSAHFVANSMGGYILQTLALQYPDLVRSAVISNSAFNTHCVFHIYLDAQRKLLEAKAPLSAIIHASCSWLFSYRYLSLPGMLDQLIKLGLENPYPFSQLGYDGQKSALDQFDSSEWVDNIQVPVLVLSGDQDIIFSEKSSRLLAEQIPQAEYIRLQDCGHLPMLEYPEIFAKLVDAFIKRSHSK